MYFGDGGDRSANGGVDLSSVVEARQRLESQLQENKAVQKVCPLISAASIWAVWFGDYPPALFARLAGGERWS